MGTSRTMVLTLKTGREWSRVELIVRILCSRQNTGAGCGAIIDTVKGRSRWSKNGSATVCLRKPGCNVLHVLPARRYPAPPEW